MMFDDLVKQNNIPIDQDDVNFIKDLIKGTVRHSARKLVPKYTSRGKLKISL